MPTAWWMGHARQTASSKDETPRFQYSLHKERGCLGLISQCRGGHTWTLGSLPELGPGSRRLAYVIIGNLTARHGAWSACTSC